jgi:hypothetical protein
MIKRSGHCQNCHNPTTFQLPIAHTIAPNTTEVRKTLHTAKY